MARGFHAALVALVALSCAAETSAVSGQRERPLLSHSSPRASSELTAVDAGSQAVLANPPFETLPAPEASSMPPATPMPRSCLAGQGWDGSDCVTARCADGYRFELGRGCVSCPSFGCAPDSEPRFGEMLPFDRGAAQQALATIDLSECRPSNGAAVVGHVTITFDPSGIVARVEVDDGPLRRTTAGACVVERFKSARVPRFGGGPVRVGKSFSLR